VGSPGAIVIGGYVNGLGLIRSLAALGVPTAVITTQPYDIAHRSRWVCAHDAGHGIVDHPEELVDLLERRAPDWRGWALLPTNDESLAALAQHHERLSSSYRVLAPPWDVARHFLDKGLMLDVARSVGVDIPRCYGPAVEATVALADLRFPVVVKPLTGYRFFSRFRTKLFVADDRRELAGAVARVADAGLPCQVFDRIPGRDDHIYAHCTYVDATGEPAAGVTVRKLRQGPPFFGVARVAEIARDRDHTSLREATVEMLRRIGFRGMVSAEFKLDPRDGSFRFMEINGRSVLYNGLLRRAGLDLAALAWADYVCERPERSQPNGWPGVWIELHADVLYSALCRRRERLGLAELLAPYGRPKIHAVWSARDPAPFVAQWSRTVRDGATTLWRGTQHERIADRARPLRA
jgi:predicted ATP-grasp superfamily ATP-dependent carboligase